MLRVTGTGPRPLEALALAGLLAPAPGRVAGPGGAADALAEAAGSGPTLCLVDDADDLDDVSATVIASVMDRVDLTVFATSRPPLTGEQTLERMLARRESIVLRAMPVPFDEMQRIVGDVVGGEIDPATTGRIYALSGGLPGVARAIAAEARRAGRLVFADGVWRTAAELWTPGLDMLAARLTRGLADDEREALWPLAELGPAPAASARRLVPASEGCSPQRRWRRRWTMLRGIRAPRRPLPRPPPPRPRRPPSSAGCCASISPESSRPRDPTGNMSRPMRPLSRMSL